MSRTLFTHPRSRGTLGLGPLAFSTLPARGTLSSLWSRPCRMWASPRSPQGAETLLRGGGGFLASRKGQKPRGQPSSPGQRPPGPGQGSAAYVPATQLRLLGCWPHCFSPTVWGGGPMGCREKGLSVGERAGTPGPGSPGGRDPLSGTQDDLPWPLPPLHQRPCLERAKLFLCWLRHRPAQHRAGGPPVTLPLTVRAFPFSRAHGEKLDWPEAPGWGQGGASGCREGPCPSPQTPARSLRQMRFLPPVSASQAPRWTSMGMGLAP